MADQPGPVPEAAISGDMTLAEFLASLRAGLTPLSEAPANVNATSALPDDVRESVAVANIKTIGEAFAAYAAMNMADAVNHARRVNVIAETAMSRSIDLINNLGPAEARAATQVLTGQDIAAQVLQLLTAAGVVAEKKAA